LATFAALLLIENHKLRSGRAGIIHHLTQLSAEGAGLADHPGAGPFLWFAGGPETDEDRRRTQQRRDYESARAGWSGKVRSQLQKNAPEFIADWDACDPSKQLELLRDVIRELRRTP
jgi:hypothetical protein